MTASAERQRYVYGIVRAPGVAVRGAGVSGAAVLAIEDDGIVALTSEVDAGPLEAGRDDVLAHSRVLQEALEGGTVLPMRFGVVAPDEEAVRAELLDRHREQLETQLDRLDGKVELNVKAIYHEEALFGEVVAESPAVSELRSAVAGKVQEATYYERIQLGELVAAAVDAKRGRDEELIVGRLEPLAIDLDVAPPVHERMAANLSFLVERSGVARFEAVLEELAAEQHRRLRFKYTGPLPPHSFVELSVGGE